jgi:hypothetical protein
MFLEMLTEPKSWDRSTSQLIQNKLAQRRSLSIISRLSNRYIALSDEFWGAEHRKTGFFASRSHK